MTTQDNSQIIPAGSQESADRLAYEMARAKAMWLIHTVAALDEIAAWSSGGSDSGPVR